MEKLEPPGPWIFVPLKSLSNDLLKVSVSYVNGIAIIIGNQHCVVIVVILHVGVSKCKGM